jgi:hypothetical protein
VWVGTDRKGKVVLVDKVRKRICNKVAKGVRGGLIKQRRGKIQYLSPPPPALVHTVAVTGGEQMLLQQAGFTLSSKKSRRPPLWLYIYRTIIQTKNSPWFS